MSLDFNYENVGFMLRLVVFLLIAVALAHGCINFVIAIIWLTTYLFNTVQTLTATRDRLAAAARIW